MPCNCKETRKVKSCPTVSVEETLLTELRNFYSYVVAKFTALFALPAMSERTASYTVADFVADTASPGTFTIPANCVCLQFMPTGVGDPGDTAVLTAPSGRMLRLAVRPTDERHPIIIPLPANMYHEAGEWVATMDPLYLPGASAGWRVIMTYEET